MGTEIIIGALSCIIVGIGPKTKIKMLPNNGNWSWNTLFLTNNMHRYNKDLRILLEHCYSRMISDDMVQQCNVANVTERLSNLVGSFYAYILDDPSVRSF